MIKVSFSQAIDADLINIYGFIPDNPYVAFNCFINSKFAGIGGYVTSNDYATLFLNVIDNKHKIAISRVLLTELHALKKTGMKFNIIRDINEPNSEIFLKKLGFALSYTIDDNEVWELINESNTI